MPADTTPCSLSLQTPAPAAPDPVHDLLRGYLARVPDSAAEQEAFALWQNLQDGPNSGQDSGQTESRLQELANRDSLVATFALADRLYASSQPADKKRGEPVLLALCDQGFAPAFASLLHKATPASLFEARDTRLPGLLVRGHQLGLAFCHVLLGRCCQAGTLALSADEVAHLQEELLALAGSGSPDSLTALDVLLRWAMRQGPNFLADATRTRALQLLAAAAEKQDGPEALPGLVLQAAVLDDGTLLPRDKKRARRACLRALELQPDNVDTACVLAGMLVDLDLAAPLDLVAALLQQGCAHKHVPSLLCRARMLRVDDAYDPKIREVLAEAAFLGEAGPYTDLLWEKMQDIMEIEEAYGSFGELQLLEPHSPAARHKVALARRALACHTRSFHLTLPKFEQSWTEQLEQCVSLRYGPACASLAEMWIFASHGCPRNLDRARAYTRAGRTMHDVRSMVLDVLIDFDAFEEAGACVDDDPELAKADVNTRLFARFGQQVATLLWAARKGDTLAAAMLFCLAAGIGYGKPADLDRPMLAALCQSILGDENMWGSQEDLEDDEEEEEALVALLRLDRDRDRDADEDDPDDDLDDDLDDDPEDDPDSDTAPGEETADDREATWAKDWDDAPESLDDALDDLTGAISDALTGALSSNDPALYLYLARQFGRASKSRRATTLVRQVSRDIFDMTFLSSGSSPAQLATRLVDGANFLGADHDGNFVMPLCLTAARSGKAKTPKKQTNKAKRR